MGPQKKHKKINNSRHHNNSAKDLSEEQIKNILKEASVQVDKIKDFDLLVKEISEKLPDRQFKRILKETTTEDAVNRAGLPQDKNPKQKTSDEE